MKDHNYTKLLLTTLVVVGYSSNAHSSEITNTNTINTNNTVLPTINDMINSNFTNPIDIKNFHSNDIHENIQKKVIPALNNVCYTFDTIETKISDKIHIAHGQHLMIDHVKNILKQYQKMLQNTVAKHTNVNVIDFIRFTSAFYFTFSYYALRRAFPFNFYTFKAFDIDDITSDSKKNLPNVFTRINEFRDVLIQVLNDCFGEELQDVQKVIPCIKNILTDFQNTDFMPSSVHKLIQPNYQPNENGFYPMHYYPITSMNYEEVTKVLKKYNIPKSAINKKSFELYSKLFEELKASKRNPYNDASSYYIQTIQWLLLLSYEQEYNKQTYFKLCFLGDLSLFYVDSSLIYAYIKKYLQEINNISKSGMDTIIHFVNSNKYTVISPDSKFFKELRKYIPPIWYDE